MAQATTVGDGVDLVRVEGEDVQVDAVLGHAGHDRHRGPAQLRLQGRDTARRTCGDRPPLGEDGSAPVPTNRPVHPPPRRPGGAAMAPALQGQFGQTQADGM